MACVNKCGDLDVALDLTPKAPAMDTYLHETFFFNYNAQLIQTLIAPYQNRALNDQIGGLFVKIRDGWRYNPYVLSGKKEHYQASDIAQREEGHCIDKSVLFIAALRGLGIPARLRLAKVINHIAAERLAQKLGTTYIAPHGIAEVYVKNKWLKASNAFNESLCELYQVDALYFDGSEDAMIQPYNRENQQYMEYVEDYGYFDDVPFDFIVNTFKENYPSLAHKLKEDRFAI